MIKVANIDELPDGTAKRIVVGGEEIAIVNAGGVLYAVNDICSHEHYHLSEGEVDVDLLTIECPKHGSTFSLVDGHAQTLPAVLPVKTYGVRLVGDDVMLDLIGEHDRVREVAG